MSEYFKSALNNIGSTLVGATASFGVSDGDTRQDNPFLGQTVDLKGHKIRIERVIAEGGFGFVFKVRDVESQKVYALKRLIASDKESKEEIENEIQILQDLNPHPHIMKFISWGLINQNVYLLLSEFCGCGSLQDLKLPISNTSQINKIIYQTCLALERMHQINWIHRDLKIENILFDNEGYVKLCDFGSATSKSYHPDMDWTPIQRSLVEDEMQRHTTPMYRPPEILDTYLHYPINTAMDIWAFGCLLFTIKFARHPFEDSAKLRIINCKYSLPSDASPDDIQVQIIKSCIKVDPNERLKVDEVIKILEDNYVDLKSPCVPPKQPSPAHVPPIPPHQNLTVNQTPVTQSAIPGSAQTASSAAPSLSSGFSGFTKYLRDTSSKVMQTIASNPRQDMAGDRPVPPPALPEKGASAPSRPPPPPVTSAPKPTRPPPPRPSPSPPGDCGTPHGCPKRSPERPPEAPVGNLLNLSVDDPAPVDNLDPVASRSSSNDSRSGGFADPTVDLLGGSLPSSSTMGKGAANLDLLNDIFNSGPKPGNLVPPVPDSTLNNNLHRNTSTPNLSQIDPLKELSSFASGSSTGVSKAAAPKTNAVPVLKPQTPLKPIPVASNMPRPASYSTLSNSFQNQKAAPKQPDYSRSHFMEPMSGSAKSSTGVPPKVAPNQFEDLLQGFEKTSPPDTSNMTMAQLKKSEMLKEGYDPVKLKVMEWKEKKTRNIRALLSSLDTIVWSECRWTPVGMHQLVDPADVRKHYLKACLAIHPDKLRGDTNEELARLIFVELNDAWSEFEKQHKL